MTTTTPKAELSDQARAAIRAAQGVLAPHLSEPHVAALHSKLAAIADPDGGADDGADADDVAKAMTSMRELRKSEQLPHGMRERVEKAHLALELEHLARINPRAAEAHSDRVAKSDEALRIRTGR